MFLKVFKPQSVWNVLKLNQDYVLITALLLIKILYFSVGLGFGFGPAEMVISSVAVLLILSCWCIFLPYVARTSLLLLFDLIVSVALLADLLFYRFFHNVISIPVLFEAGQVEGVSSSVYALFSRWDFLLFLDFVFLIPYFVRLNLKHFRQPLRLRPRLRYFALLLGVCVLTLGFTSRSMAADFNKNAYIGLNWNDTVLRNMGVLNFHLFDLYNYIRSNTAKTTMANDAQDLKAWMDQRRQQGPNHFAGIAKGKNLIVVQLEAMQGFVVGKSINGQEVTPNLNRLMKSSMYFDNYFTQIGEGNTSDAEFMVLNSLYPAPTGSNYIMHSKNTYQSLPWVLREAGYQASYVFHGNKPEFWNRANMYQAEGFDKFFSTSNLKYDDVLGMGLSDESLFRQVVQTLQQTKQPYFSFVITLSAHYPYDMPPDKKELNIPQGQYSNMFVNYLQSQHYADKALGEFIDQLQKQGILDNSVLVVYGDHYGTGWTNQDIERFLGLNQPLNDYTSKELNKVPLFIRLPHGVGAGINHISGGQMDLYPTLVNLLGLNKQDLFYFGQDLLNTSKGFAAFRVWSPDGSFVTDEVFYVASKDGKFEHGTAYDRKTGQKISLQGLQDEFNKAKWQLQMSDLIISTNGFPELITIKH